MAGTAAPVTRACVAIAHGCDMRAAHAERANQIAACIRINHTVMDIEAGSASLRLSNDETHVHLSPELDPTLGGGMAYALRKEALILVIRVARGVFLL